MIILDMDGTLLNSNRIISENSKTILRKLKEQEKVIVISTGRCLEKAMEYLSEDFVDYVLASNGAIWYRMCDDKIIKKNILKNEDCINILNKYSNMIDWVYIMDIGLERFDDMKEAINFLENHEAVHISIHLKNSNNSINFMEELKNNYHNLDIILMQDSYRDFKWVDIVAKDNNKGKNVRGLIEYLNINYDNTICFGDGLNDIEMFKNVKTSIAMGNALPELKQVATHITDTYDNDGIYKFLSNYYFNNKGE